MRFFSRINTILMQCLKICSLCVFDTKLGKGLVNLIFIQRINFIFQDTAQILSI